MIRLLDLLKEDIIKTSSVIDTIKDSLPSIELLGNKTILTREFKGIKMGAAKITSGPIDKGRIGSAINPESPVYREDIAAIFKTIISKFNLEHIVYCSHGNTRFYIGGRQYCMIPVGKYKTVWSEEVKDIYAEAMSLKEKNKLNEFPINSYKNEWPTGDVNEILVDCKEYYLITTNIPIVQDYMKKKEMGTWNNKQFTPNTIQTYDQLYNILTETLQSFKTPLSN